MAGATIADADANTKGKIQLTGDLGGTAATPTVPGLTLKAPLASPIFTGTVTTNTINTGALSATSINTPIYASTPQELTDGSTITWNPSLGLNASVTLGGNRSLNFTTTPAAGSYGTLVVNQDGTGSRTITLPSINGVTNKVLGSTSTSTVALSTAANSKDILNFYFEGTTCYWNIGQGYGTAATPVSSTTNLASSVTGTLPVTNGGTGATTAAASLTNLGAAPIASPTFTGSVTAPVYASTPQALTAGSAISWNPTLGLNASVTLNQNSTLNFASTPTAGAYGTLVVTQDGTGNRTITLPSINGVANKVLGSASTSTVALSTAANAKDILNFYFDGTTCYWNIGQGYGSAATSASINLGTSVSGTLAVANGGTGQTTLTGVKNTLGLLSSKVAIGADAGLTNQGNDAIAIGYNAGLNNQGASSIAIGYLAGGTATQGSSSIAIGPISGGGGNNSVAIGLAAWTGANNATAVGTLAAAGHVNSAALGYQAVTTSPNTIQLGADGVTVQGSTAITNVRTSGSLTAGAVTYPNTNGTAGQVLTANNNGNASWTTIASVADASTMTGTVAVANGGTGTTNGSLTGTSSITITAGGSNQNIAILPSGTGSVGIGTSSPNSLAILDASSTTKGFLPPRMTYAQKTAIVSPPQGLMIYCTNCGTNGEPEYFNGTSWVNMAGGTAASVPPPPLGSTYQGGKVFYILQPNDPGYDANTPHGLIAAPSDIPYGTYKIFPSCYASYGTSTALGTGAANTTKILACTADNENAAKLVDALTDGVYSDWYLPSKDELNLLYLNRNSAGNNFASNEYWSSSELYLWNYSSYDNAWYQFFTDGSQSTTGKGYQKGVRAIRSF